jgi:phospholipid/cholesterol/gamma-HCH transport system ATP-binding protein
MIGTVGEVRNSDNERIQSLLNREARKVEINADDYMRTLTGQE